MKNPKLRDELLKNIIDMGFGKNLI